MKSKVKNVKSKIRPDNQNIWLCVCGKGFKYESEMKRHARSHSPQFECKVCNKTFSFLSALHRHEKQHDRNGLVQCNKCGSSFKDEALLQRHIQYAHKEMCPCPQCDAVFYSEIALKTHLKKHRPDSERRYRCNFIGCGKAFNFPQHLKHHVLTHTNEKQYYCKTCGKGFIQLHHWKIHCKSHDPDNWLFCPNCSKKFTTEYARKRHIATHNSTLCASCGNVILSHLCDKHLMRCQQRQDSPCDLSNIAPLKGKDKKTDANYSYKKDTETYNAITDTGEAAEPVYDDNGISLSSATIKTGEIDGTRINSRLEVDKLKYNKTSNVSYTLIEENNNKFNKFTNDTNAQANCNNTVVATKESVYSDLTIESEQINNNKTNRNNCEGCDCSKTRPSCTDIQNQNNKPLLEYRLDGTVKLKETFDIDIEFSVKRESKSVLLSKEFELKHTNKQTRPYNFTTCKDVLGNCIVSGNGTIGEGCLCAKMCMNDQEMTAQEIDEITPFPDNSSGWLD